MGIPGLLASACGVRPLPAPTERDCHYGNALSQSFDVYSPPGTRGGLNPLVVMIHGGGWENGSRNDVAQLIPYFTERQYVVANVDYRLAAEAIAPAAVEDVRNAIEYVRYRASKWGADSQKLILVGFSAGAHLALLSALAPATVVTGPQSHPAAIINFWGITDVMDLLEGANAREFARRWIPVQDGWEDLARKLSPIHYDAEESLTLCAVHSVNDDIVPFHHSEALVAKLRQAKRRAHLIELSHQGHAAPSNDYPSIFSQIFRFMEHSEGIR